MKNICSVTAIAGLAGGVLSVFSAPVQALTPGHDARGCGWYIILGCSKSLTEAGRTLSRLGGPMVGGGAGSRVLDTSDVDGFRNGFYCVADGPYVSEADAGSVAWREVVSDAYIKRGC